MASRVLMIDDLFGRGVSQGRNAERESLCANLLLRDVTADAAARAGRQRVLEPVAEAVFCRGQRPGTAGVGDAVENDAAAAMSAVRTGWAEALAEGRPPWTMVLLDLCFYTGRVTEASDRRTPGMPEGRTGDDDPRSYFGLTLLDAIRHEFPELPVFILSSKPREEVSLEFSRRGALGFIDRSDARAPELLEAALWNHGLLPDPAGELLGHSLPVLLALREARRAAGHCENVLIRGERGTGKELMARYLNRVASRDGKKRPFVAVNSAVFTPNLFASELFGIQPRTATGVEGKTGLIEWAKGGDLFLDEIADMPADVQAAILRVLQDREVTKVGGREAIPVEVRFLSATNADLGDDDPHFRPDLLDRLRQGGTVWLPPLRERPADIPLLVEQFVRQAEAQRADTRRREVTPEAMEAIKAHDWPGNVRELRSVVFEAVTRHPDVEYLVPGHLRLRQPDGTRRSANSGPVFPTGDQVASLDSLLSKMADVTTDPGRVDDWAGKLTQVQQEHARLVARLLGAAIEATKRRTPEHPEGQIQIHPAVKLLTGDSKLTASQAADVIKRLLRPLNDELAGDLLEAYETALRLRPKSGRAPRC